MNKIIENLKKNGFSGEIKTDELLKNHTTMHVGGKAALFLLPESVEDVFLAVRELKKLEKKFYVLGGGSNLIFSDDGFQGAVICMDQLSEIAVKNNSDNQVELYCKAGKKTAEIAEYCLKNNIAGMECFSGLPGTCGGACFMNARCYDDEISKHVKTVKYLDLKAEKICDYEFNEKDWSYKVSPFQDGNKIILECVFNNLKKIDSQSEEAAKIAEKAAGYVKNREEKGHFKCYSAGSVFKNNRDFGKPSGVLIDEAGLKGLSCGDAQVAPWHGNFIINNGNASAADIKNLVKEVQDKVYLKTGFMLDPEIIFV